MLESIAAALLLVAAACGHDWDQLDPRQQAAAGEGGVGASGGATSTGGNGGALIGQAAEPTCVPLNQVLHQSDCAQTTAWFCGTTNPALDEATIVTKSSAAEGGALCCRD